MKTYIINVRSNEARRNHMISMLKKQNCIKNYSFMHSGDIEDINESIANKYFGGRLNSINPILSCAYKHILVYYALINDNENDYYLIFEDDIFLDDNFCKVLNNISTEIKNRDINKFIISLEDSSLQYVKNSSREKTHIYIKLKPEEWQGHIS